MMCFLFLICVTIYCSFPYCSWPVDGLKLLFSFDYTFNAENNTLPETVINNSPTFKRVLDPVPFGVSADFNVGESDNLEVLNPEELEITLSPLTVSLWFKRRTEDTHMDIVSIDGETHGRDFYISIRPISGGRMINVGKGISGFNRYRDSTTLPSIDTWYHLAVTHDNTDGADNMKMYLDNVLESITAESNVAIVGPYDQPLRIGGGSAGGATFHYDGELGCIHIYNRVLDSGEISALYTDGCSCFASYYYCYGYHYEEGEVCSGHGECIGNDRCECEYGYGGANCSETYYCRYPTDNLVGIFPFYESFDAISGPNNYVLLSSTVLTNHLGAEEAQITSEINDTENTYVPFKNAVSFSGAGEHLEIPTNISNMTEFTFSVWAYPSQSSLMDLLSIDGEAKGREIAIVWQVSDKIHGDAVIDNFFRIFESANSFPPATIWYHIVVVSNGTDVKLFVNGQEEEFNYSNDLDLLAPFDQPLRIGGGAPSGELQLPFNGKLACVHIYNSSLTEEEVVWLYEDGCSCFTDYGDLSTCFGVDWNDFQRTCSGHGNCVAQDTCNCDPEFYGENCDVSSYFEYIRGDLLGDGLGGKYSCSGLDNSSRPGGRSRLGNGFFGSAGNEVMIMFGGYGYASVDGQLGHLNDLWSLDTHNELWCYIKGSNLTDSTDNQFGSSEESVFDEYHLPGSRSTYAFFTTLFSFFIFGGQKSGGYELFHADNNYTNELWELTMFPTSSAYQWRQVWGHVDNVSTTEIPSKRGSHCASYERNNNIVYIFGGGTLDDNDDDTTALLMNDLWKYDVLTNEFELLRTEEENNSSSATLDFGWNSTEFYSLTPSRDFSDPFLDPPHRHSHLCWVDKVSSSNLYVFGGTLRNMRSKNDVWMYNSTLNSWGWVSGTIGDLQENQFSTDEFLYDSLNIPASRSSSILLFGGSDKGIDNFEDDDALFFGGTYEESYSNDLLLFSDLWSFSNRLWEFRFVNGSRVGNEKNSQTQIGSRYSGVGGKFLHSNKILIFGGELLD